MMGLYGWEWGPSMVGSVWKVGRVPVWRCLYGGGGHSLVSSVQRRYEYSGVCTESLGGQTPVETLPSLNVWNTGGKNMPLKG